VYLVRHGAAVDEGELSAEGEQQARLLGERLKDIPFAAIHHSPLQRAARTARLVAEFLPHVPVHSSDLLGDYLPFKPSRAALPPFTPGFSTGIRLPKSPKGRRWRARRSSATRCPPRGTPTN
jgi:serine/threonine-protein phosphatase PGAM5